VKGAASGLAAVEPGVAGAAAAFVDERQVPGAGALVHSVEGIKVRGPGGGVLLPHQRLALETVGDFLGGHAGSKPLRSALIFHSMGSGKSAIVHAIVSLVRGAASGLEGGAEPKLLSCRIALLWQSMPDAERQMSFLRANQFGVFGGTVAPNVAIPGIITASIDKSADHDALKNQIGLPTRGWLRTMETAKEAEKAAKESLASDEVKVRELSKYMSQLGLDLAQARNTNVTIYSQKPVHSETHLQAELKEATRKHAELLKAVAEKAKGVVAATGAAQQASVVTACTEATKTLVVVDECHKLFADGNLAYPLLLACAACGHAAVVLMSGTPVTSSSPLRELTRLLMLLGGREWIMEAARQVGDDALRASVAATCQYATLQAVLNSNAGTDKAGVYDARIAQAEATLGRVNAVLKQVEEKVVETLGRAASKKAAISALIELTPVRISYYGLLNGNRENHDKYRDRFDTYDHSAVLKKLRDTHVAAVSGATQRHEVAKYKLDDNFEFFPDGQMYSRTVDPTAYRVDYKTGGVAWVKSAVGPGPPRWNPNRAWHSCREYIPSFVKNRVVRVLHVTVPSYFERWDWKKLPNGETALDEQKRPIKQELGMRAPGPLIDGVPVAYVTEWLTRNLATTPAWSAPEGGARDMFQVLGKQWKYYQFVWALGVAFAAACAARHEVPEAQRGPVVLYLDRKSYDLTRAQMELLVHAVFDSKVSAHNLHAACKYRGVPYRGPRTPTEGVLSYQIGWPSEIDASARPLSAWFDGAAGVAAAAFGDDVTASARAEALLSSFGEMFALPLAEVYAAVQRETTLFDEQLKLDLTSPDASRSRELMHVLVKDAFVDEPNGTSFNPEGDDLGFCRVLIFLGMYEFMTAQQMEQLFDRVNRVNVKKNGRAKMIMHITAHAQLAKDSTLGMLGTTELDVVVDHILSELAAHAVDCEDNRTPAEAAAFKCKKKSQ
jgi:hypothetical protein